MPPNSINNGWVETTLIKILSIKISQKGKKVKIILSTTFSRKKKNKSSNQILLTMISRKQQVQNFFVLT